MLETTISYKLIQTREFYENLLGGKGNLLKIYWNLLVWKNEKNDQKSMGIVFIYFIVK